MKKSFILVLILPLISISQNSNFIHVDQFGYRTLHTKVAVISSPQIGFNSNQSYNPGNTLQLREANTNAVVFSGGISQWNNGNIHSQSGDNGWWFDFSSVTTPGSYYVFDPTTNETSAVFEINDTIYDNLLIAASKMFFYNRCGFEKTQPYALEGYTDAISFAQDEFARDVYDQSNTSTTKDMRGGWFDAGDYNKYVTFAESPVHNLLWAYQSNPTVFTDNFNIPESGNGIPDILDEIKWETDWLLKMIETDGSVRIKMGNRNYAENGSAPPSANNDIRYYGPVCTSSAIAMASMLAHAAKVFSQFPDLSPYAQTLEDNAVFCWTWALPYLNSNNLQENCDDGSIVAGDADRTSTEQREMALTAAAYLFDLTGSNTYNQYLIDNINDTAVINNSEWNNYNIPVIDALLNYTTLANANATLKSIIESSALTSASNNYNNYFQFNMLDLYRGYSNDWTYHWGSNMSRANMGNLNLIFSDYNINTSASSNYKLRAKEMLHYFHGVNPLDIVYLSNMSAYGAENSLDEIYHGWFHDGNSNWDNVQTSTYGPAPGYLAGGPNQNYTANTNLSPPYNQPIQKSYLDFNTSSPDNSWEITEPAIYYQAAYIRLLSRISNLNENDTLSDTDFEVADNEVRLLPNPSKNGFSIVSPNLLNIEISISNLQGQEVLNKKKYNTGEFINISNLISGIYLVNLNSDNSQKTLKLIKE